MVVNMHFKVFKILPSVSRQHETLIKLAKGKLLNCFMVFSFCSRQVNKSKSVLEVLLFRNDQNADDLRNKNIRQTELLVDLREAILQVGRHFQVRNFCIYIH